MDDVIVTLEDAFNQAAAEMAAATTVDAEGAQPAPEAKAADQGEHADTGTSDQTEPEASSEKNPLDALAESDEGGDSPSGLDPTSEDFWSRTVEVEGLGEVTLQEMRDGYLRQADYTRKTQELASERKLAAEAVEFYTSFKEDPAAFGRFLVSRLGLDVGDIPDVDVKLWTPEEVEAEVEARLEKAIEEHPDVKAARQQAGIQAVDQEFSRLEKKYGYSFSPQNRVQILQEANRRQTTDLELVTESLLHRAQQVLRERENARSSSPARPSRPAEGESTGQRVKPKNIAEAMEQARAELEDAVASAQ